MRIPDALPLLAALLLCGPASAPAAEKPEALTIETGRGQGAFVLAGRDASQQLLVMGRLAGGKDVDLTREVAYEPSPAGIVAVDATGLVTPVKEGEATIQARGPSGLSASVKVTVTRQAVDVPINFANEVVPIFTKFGCNAGGCHGKADGQNGFKLSLLGFEPTEDYEFLVKEARGRRLAFSAPVASPLLLKATGESAHGGGRRLEKDGAFYRVVLRWIEQGAPYGRPDDAHVERIEVLPRERVLDRGAKQQLTVVAHLSDGSTRDVTRMTQFEPGQPEMAEVSGTGLVTIKTLPGVIGVMARFQSQVAVFRGTAPLGATVGTLPPVRNFIDQHVFAQWQKLGLPPSEIADDGTFLRRVTIDLAGRLPTREEIEAFVADTAADKHEKAVDTLLGSAQYAEYFASKWSAILRNRRSSTKDNPAPTVAFHAWIRQQIQDNTPYDQFARAVLTATGDETTNPAVVWYREVRDPAAQLEDAAQLFLGQRIQCAKCHHHPMEKWSQQDYWGMAAFFSQLEVKLPAPPKAEKGKPAPPPGPVIIVGHKGGVASSKNPRTNKTVKPAGLGGPTLDLPKEMDPREKLAEWMTATDNPFFARTLANRYWKHFLGRGLVDPEDDMRATNPASNPELLEALTKHFVESKYDMKGLIRTICTSTTYRLSAVPNNHNASDRQNYSRYLPRRLPAEVLLDAIDQVTGTKSTFKGSTSVTRAVQLPDNLVDSYFLSVFGRPDFGSACECERSSDATLAQSLHMINSTEILGKVGDKGGRAAKLATDKRGDKEKLEELYLVALGRKPTAEEVAVLTGYVEKKKGTLQVAYEDIVWAVINTKEFQFNH